MTIPGYRHLAGNVFMANAPTRTAPVSARPAPSPAQAVVDALTAARTAALTPRADSAGLAQADMRRQLAAAGIPVAR